MMRPVVRRQHVVAEIVAGFRHAEWMWLPLAWVLSCSMSSVGPWTR